MNKLEERKLIIQNQLKNRNIIPKCCLALDEETLRKKREELKKKLANNEKVTIGKDGEVKPEDKKNNNSGNEIVIPPGKLAFFGEIFLYFKDAANKITDRLFSKEQKSISKADIEKIIDEKFDEILKEERMNNLQTDVDKLNQEIFALKNSILNMILTNTIFTLNNNLINQNFDNMSNLPLYRNRFANDLSGQFAKYFFPLLQNEGNINDYIKCAMDNGIPVAFTNGEISVSSNNTGSDILIPPGKFASFYWYEREPVLFNDEKIAMKKFFPNFTLHKLTDGRLYWEGTIRPKIIGNNEWNLMLVYENNHPSNDSWGGSVKVYSVSPDLEQMQKDLGCAIPHLLRDSDNSIYLCTARKEDVHAAKQEEIGGKVTSAASSLSWAVKWISVYEMWLSGEVTTSEFQGHTF